MALRLVDTHAHLNLDPFDQCLNETIENAKAAGVESIVVIGIDLASSVIACELASRHPGFLFAAVGIQPNSAATAEANDFRSIEDLVSRPGVVAIGETGLDCYWDDTPIEMQHAFFDSHLELCRKTGLPVIIHMRESGQLIVEQLRRQPEVPAGIMHSFTGDWDCAAACLDLGMHISFAGMVTFKKSHELRDVAKRVPEDRLLIETDSPYLSPEPLRGKRPNEPARVEHTLRCLAEVRGVSADHLAERTTENAKRLLRLKHPVDA
ncbi:MAG: TatD family hydrolase [Planctomycetota bacterium]